MDFLPDGRYSALVEVKAKKAHEWIDAQGKIAACKGMEEVLAQFLPDIFALDRRTSLKALANKAIRTSGWYILDFPSS